MKVKLCGIKQVSKFISIARFFKSRVYVISENKKLDAKSILCVFNLNYLEDDIYVQIDSKDDKEIEKFRFMMEEFEG